VDNNVHCPNCGYGNSTKNYSEYGWWSKCLVCGYIITENDRRMFAVYYILLLLFLLFGIWIGCNVNKQDRRIDQQNIVQLEEEIKLLKEKL
jgi:uncharacterized protein (DUF983 family)